MNMSGSGSTEVPTRHRGSIGAAGSGSSNSRPVSSLLYAPAGPPWPPLQEQQGRELSEHVCVRVPAKGAVAWGRQGLAAYGCQCCVVVVDPSSLALLQTLDEHRAPVTCLQWGHESWEDKTSVEYPLILASGDAAGSVIVWDVLKAEIKATMESGQEDAAVLGLSWHPEEPSLLLSLHHPSTIIQWDTATGNKLWSRELPEKLLAVEFDRFNPEELWAASAEGNMYLINVLMDSTLILTWATRVVGEPRSAPAGEAVLRNSAGQHEGAGKLLQMAFSPTARHVVYFLFPHRVVGTIALEASKSPFRHMILSGAPTRIFCLQFDGSLIVYKKHEGQSYTFYRECLCEAPKQFKPGKKNQQTGAYGIAVSPLQPHQLIGLMSDSNLWRWDFVEGGSPTRAGGRVYVSGQAHHLSNPIVDMVKLRTRSQYLVHGPIAPSNFPVRGLYWLTASTLIFYTCEDVGKGEFMNKVFLLDLHTGRLREIRKSSAAEATFIRGLRVSPLRQYFVLMLKDKPFELWDIASLSTIALLKASQVTALDWCPTQGTPTGAGVRPREQFMFVLADGTTHQHSVGDGGVTVVPFQGEVGTGIISSIAWYYCSGTIHCYNLETKRALVFNTNKGLVRNIVFAPGDKGHQILVNFSEGEFGVWDVDHGVRISTSSYLKSRDLRALDLDWLTPSHPVVSTSDGCVRVLDRSLSSSPSPILWEHVAEEAPLHSPALLGGFLPAMLKVHLLHPRSKVPRGLVEALDALDADTLQTLRDPSLSITERCRRVATYFADENEIRFWTLAGHFLAGPPQGTAASSLSVDDLTSKRATLQATPTTASGGVVGGDGGDDPNSRPPASAAASIPAEAGGGAPKLEFGVLCSSRTARTLEWERARASELASANITYDLSRKLTDLHLLLGERDKAMRLLLDTPAAHPNFYPDMLKACVVAASHSQQSFQQTVGEVAHNMVASGWLEDGVQLLCLVGRGAEACRHLQDHARWTDAAWLAKIVLSDAEAAAVLRHWVAHLVTAGRKAKAAEILLSLGEGAEAVELLYEAGELGRAALLAQACPADRKPEPGLLTRVYADYAARLKALGHPAMSHYQALLSTLVNSLSS
ncbi:WD domain, G-beta repeat-containing protein [Acanthamoeba castellanii str. Neff]|uniref:WD domain, G-beta repeat-containing protein n=1 Tax=Acanthamoeba castellanii (strain ATCC 30010 / Neff) TaxID=1257118 RepID=L8GLL9_ACACF|nr:WD domain, G-beta repeat-containing protein [Acanthamoeba castellanii str. Neff]ELR13975.1 WD domain, G-beta repeat-containing protein [Acanthamoeba castellanii str. Neff]